MNRRNFLKILGLGAPAIAIAPKEGLGAWIKKAMERGAVKEIEKQELVTIFGYSSSLTANLSPSQLGEYRRRVEKIDGPFVIKRQNSVPEPEEEWYCDPRYSEFMY